MLDDIGPAPGRPWESGGAGIAERKILGRNQDIRCSLLSNHAYSPTLGMRPSRLDGSSLAGYWFGDLLRLMTEAVTCEPMARKLAQARPVPIPPVVRRLVRSPWRLTAGRSRRGRRA